MALGSSGRTVVTDAAKAVKQRQNIRADNSVFFTGLLARRHVAALRIQHTRRRGGWFVLLARLLGPDHRLAMLQSQSGLRGDQLLPRGNLTVRSLSGEHRSIFRVA